MKNNNIIRNKILAFYKLNKRDLPWRTMADNDQDPYHTLISEIMLQQTQVNKVVEYYKRFVCKWPSVESLAVASIEEVLTLWSGLGYYRRAKYLHDSAKIINIKFHGIIPNDKKLLLQLPGVGEYTANAIISFAYQKYAIALDTNIKRFIIRMYGLKKDIFKNKSKLLFYGTKIYPKKNSGRFSQAIMDFTSSICKKTNPTCSKCFLTNFCKYNKKNKKKLEILKRKTIKEKFSIVYIYIYKKKFFLLKKRSIDKMLGGLYEVPGTEWVLNNWPEVKENLKDKKFLPKTLTHRFSHFKLKIKIIIIRTKRKRIEENYDIWIHQGELNKIPISSLTKKIINYAFKELAI